MRNSNGIEWGDTYGSCVFQSGPVIADIMSAILSKGEQELWVDNIRGKPQLATEKTCRTFCTVKIVRSDTCAPTEDDIASMDVLGLPMLKVALPTGAFKMYYPLSLEGNLPYEGRQWSPNYADCYRLLLDYYKTELSIKLPVVVTPENYVAQSRSYTGQNLFLTNWESSGFTQVMVPQDGDLIYMRTGNPMVQGPDHCGIYLEGDKLLHHFINRLSTVQEYAGIWRASTVMVLRHHTRL